MASAFTSGRNNSAKARTACGLIPSEIDITHSCPKCNAKARKFYELGMSWDEIVNDAYLDHEMIEEMA